MEAGNSLVGKLQVELPPAARTVQFPVLRGIRSEHNRPVDSPLYAALVRFFGIFSPA
jgi:hypothetical protein